MRLFTEARPNSEAAQLWAWKGSTVDEPHKPYFSNHTTTYLATIYPVHYPNQDLTCLVIGEDNRKISVEIPLAPGYDNWKQLMEELQDGQPITSLSAAVALQNLALSGLHKVKPDVTFAVLSTIGGARNLQSRDSFWIQYASGSGTRFGSALDPHSTSVVSIFSDWGNIFEEPITGRQPKDVVRLADRLQRRLGFSLQPENPEEWRQGLAELRDFHPY